MKNKMRMLLLIVVGISMIMQYACSDDKSGGNYDGPLKLNTFYPDSGYLSSKIILEGENFGTDASKLSVYFNEKKGFISKASGNILMVYAPKLPGDNCKISVVKGEETAVFDDVFRYISRFTVGNVCGKPGSGYNLGTDLASTTFANWGPKVSCCDSEGNYYVCYSDFNAGTGGLALISEKNNLSKRITQTMVNDVLYHQASGKLYAVAPKKNFILELDPTNDWKVKNRYLKSVVPPAIQVDITRIACLAYCSFDDYLYGRTASKQLFRFKLDDLVCEYIKNDLYNMGDNEENKSIVSMMFDPKEPTKLYTSYGSSCVITVQDITNLDSEEEVYAGHLNEHANGGPDQIINGYRTDCLFHWNNQMAIIADDSGQKSMYIADAGTHTIRKIDMVTGMVTTVVGRQRVAGNQSGTPLEATFNWPKGIGLTLEGDLYISDSASGCIRKLSLR